MGSIKSERNTLANAPAFNDDEHEKAWLIRVMVNRCKNELRLFWRKHRADLSELQGISAEAKDIDLLIDVFSLPARYKDAIYMHYYEGYTVNETAERLDLSPSAVKMRLSRAREMLRWEGEDNG
jgi:RNA polymerase sigma-70 factor (ECF subfamily)